MTDTLPPGLDLLDPTQIRRDLSAAASAWLTRLEIYPVLDSTNNYLLAKAEKDWPSGAVCLTEQQQAGRGRLGRAWLSSFAGSLAGSLLWRFSSAAVLSGLSLATGIAVARALRRCGVAEVGLKWPNDVWWRRRKLGGILLESGNAANGGCFVVAGVGLNVALPPPTVGAIDQPWVDLREILGPGPISRNRLAAVLLSEWLETFARFQQDGFRDLAAEWADFDQVAGRRVRLILPNATLSGIARGVDANGALLLETATGRLQPCMGGEISLRLEP